MGISSLGGRVDGVHDGIGFVEMYKIFCDAEYIFLWTKYHETEYSACIFHRIPGILGRGQTRVECQEVRTH